MGFVESIAVSGVIAGAFYLMNQERARARGATKKLQSSTLSLFVVVAAVTLLTSFFISGGGSSAKRSSGGAGDYDGFQSGGASGTPIDVALRQISMEEPYW